MNRSFGLCMQALPLAGSNTMTMMTPIAGAQLDRPSEVAPPNS